MFVVHAFSFAFRYSSVTSRGEGISVTGCEPTRYTTNHPRGRANVYAANPEQTQTKPAPQPLSARVVILALLISGGETTVTIRGKGKGGRNQEMALAFAVELYEAGINVWTTLNIQHIESLNDLVAQITGVRQRETIPDSVLDETVTLAGVHALVHSAGRDRPGVGGLASENVVPQWRDVNRDGWRDLVLSFPADSIAPGPGTLPTHVTSGQSRPLPPAGP